MEIRHADLQIEVEDAEDGGVLLTIIDSARLSLLLPRKTATELLDAIDACMKTGERQTTDSVDVWRTGNAVSARLTRATANIMRGTPEGCSSGRVRASGAVAPAMGRSAAVRPPAGLCACLRAA